MLGQIDAIGVDEIQYSKGHKYLTLVYQIDLGVTRLIWVGKERTPLLQPEDRPCLPSQGSLPATLELQLARLGRQVPRRVVSADDSFPHRAHEEDRPLICVSIER